MYQHVLLIYSDYSLGKRIAFHKYYEYIEDMREFFELSRYIKDKFKQLTFSFHHIQTKVVDTNSLSEYDGYFKNIEYYEDIDEFIELISEDTTIRPIDIAKVILCKKSFTHLELEKIMYFSYCEYLREYHSPMFLEEFEAWRYGPVIPEVYHEFKKYSRSKIKINDKDKLLVWSKIMKFKSYDKLLRVIDKTLEEYGKCTARQLVDKSHEKDSPWYIVYRDGEGKNNKIPKELIEEFLEKEYLCLV